MSRQKKTTTQSTVAKKNVLSRSDGNSLHDYGILEYFVNEPKTLENEIQQLEDQITAINRQTKAIVSEKRLYKEGDSKYAELEEQYKELSKDRKNIHGKKKYRERKKLSDLNDIRGYKMTEEEREDALSTLIRKRSEMNAQINTKRAKIHKLSTSEKEQRKLEKEVAETLIARNKLNSRISFHRNKIKESQSD